jgi:methylphosphotriester-DNA--protein-cysteine methyltransferase
MKILHEKFQVPADLAPYIESLWMLQSSEAEDSELSEVGCCLPNGGWELMFRAGPGALHITCEDESMWIPEMSSLATNSSPVYWQLKGNLTVFGMVLLPETIELLCKGPTLLHELRFENLKKYQQEVFEDLQQLAEQVKSPEELAKYAFAILRKHLLSSKTQQNPYFSEAMRLIRSNLDKQNLDDLNQKVFVSKRHLQRTFQNKVGYGPKAYSRMLRFCEAIFYLQQNPNARMTSVAYDFGYADQSHFIREFKEFMGQNPRKFFADWPVGTKAIIHKTFAYL